MTGESAHNCKRAQTARAAKQSLEWRSRWSGRAIARAAEHLLTWTCGNTQPPTPQVSMFAPNHCTHAALEEGQDIGEVVAGVLLAESLRRLASARYSSPCSTIEVSRLAKEPQGRPVRKRLRFLALRASQWSLPAACGNTSGLDSYRTLVALAKRNLRPTALLRLCHVHLGSARARSCATA